MHFVYGGSWTPDNPANIPNYREAAGLPSGGSSGYNNTGQFIIEGTVKNRDIIKNTTAAPLDGNPEGGDREYQVNPKNVKINIISGVNPEF